MPATVATKGQGTLLKIGDGAGPEVFTTIAEVRDINGLSLEQLTEEATNQGSPGGWMEHVGTLLNAGDLTFDLNFLPADATQSFAAGLIKDMVNRTKRNFELIFTDPALTKWTFAALVVNFGPSMPIAGLTTAAVTLRVTGQPTLA